jgi:hypothetical protein
MEVVTSSSGTLSDVEGSFDEPSRVTHKRTSESATIRSCKTARFDSGAEEDDMSG